MRVMGGLEVVGFQVGVVRSGLGMQMWFLCGERIRVGDGMGWSPGWDWIWGMLGTAYGHRGRGGW